MDRLQMFLGNFPFIRNPQGPFQTKLSKEQEAAFRQWLQQNKQQGPIKYFNPDDPMSDYDMRGYWQGLMNKDPRAHQGIASDGLLHFTDTWKTPYHQSFSNESIYAKPDYAPYWQGNSLLHPKTGEVLYKDE